MSQYNQNIRPKNAGTKALFSNPILERFSRTHIAVPVSLFSILSVGLLYYALAAKNLLLLPTLGLFVAGFFFFTLLEYLAHRYFFHMEPTNKLKTKVQYAIHGIHHEYPKDKDRLAMPPLLALVYAMLLFLAFRLLLGEYTFAFLPGMLLGYATYISVHYIVHAYQPPNNIFKTLWVHHAIHHYKDHTVAFGVSSPMWDYIFRTMPK
jgi:sterol desaturase/sphingolipid hydroxylase (fatty acid hydroxylase superfamily)